MGRLFGTDGVRGVAGRDLDAVLAMSLSVAAAAVLADSDAFDLARKAGRRPVAVVGRDSRASGEFLEAAVVAGLAGSGVDVLRLGIIPTPAVAYLTGELDAELGVMLSASHNPAADNGIKFFARGGHKLPDAVEDEIELRLTTAPPAPGVPEAGFGRVTDAAGLSEQYLSHLLRTLPGTGAGQPLAGLRVVVDCAHGAAYEIAPRMLRAAGATVVAVGAAPDGLNINADCGSTCLGTLVEAVAEHGADVGIAHDGDADRCLAVDADGHVVDGDQILAVLALRLKAAGALAGNTVVTTVMSNLGFRLAMRDAGIEVVQTPVGDRYLGTAMREGSFALGGEQSGHIILLDYATTGDGLLTSLQLLAAMAGSGKSLADLASVMTRYPQVLITVSGVDKARVGSSAELSAAVRAAEDELGETGRILVRPSGTESAIRIMVEATDADQAGRLAEQLAATVRRLG